MSEIITLNKLINLPSDAKQRIKEKTFVGIDFGTSTTVVSFAALTNENTIFCDTLHLSQKEADGATTEAELLPTVIAISDSGKLLVGQGAYSLKGNPDYVFGENIWHSFKMELGKDLGPRWYNSRQSKIKSPQDATKMFFKYLRKQVEKACKDNGLSTNIDYAVSIPASFESNQRKDLLDALEANGIPMTGKTLIDEPNAAFMGYINHDYEQKKIVFSKAYNPKVLVFDFGAGTCDISIIEIGIGNNGLKTRNISISQFTELGGNDIDRYIAWNFLLPKFLEKNGKGEDDFTMKQMEVIVNQLLGIAENLKKEASKAFHFFLQDKDLISEMKNMKGVKVTVPTTVYTEDGNLTQDVFTLSYEEFLTAMKAFFDNKNLPFSKTVKRQKKYNSIYASLQSAIKKAHISKNEINYVMMVGGSSKNPFVQQCIKDYFPNEVLIGQDIQSLVSQGAAIHSLLVNAFDISIVRPITSEPIVIITEGEKVTPIIPAGTEIPFSPIKVEKLTTASEERSTVEIPICVTNEKKQLANLIIEDAEGGLLPADEPIELFFEMTADKLLKVTAKCGDSICNVDSENPFANTYLTNEEKKILKAERELYIDAERNGGTPSRQAFDKLCKLYDEADKDYMAAELLEEKNKYYPSTDNNRIGVFYHNSGNYNKAIKFFQKELEANEAQAVVHSNLGNDLQIIGKNEEAKRHLERAIELRGDYAIPMIVLGEIHSYEGNSEKANEYNTRAKNILTRQLRDKVLDDVTMGWFESLARTMKDWDLEKEIKDSRKKKTYEVGYNKDNLAKIKSKEELL